VVVCKGDGGKKLILMRHGKSTWECAKNPNLITPRFAHG